MFFICLPTTFKVGDTADVRINGEPARVTWRGPDTLVIEPDDAREIIFVEEGGGLLLIHCGDAGESKADYLTAPPPGAARSRNEKPPTYEEIFQAIDGAEPLLRCVWTARRADDDIIVLADVRRPECRPLILGFWEQIHIDLALASGIALPVLPYLQPARLLDTLLRGRSRAQQAAARELRGFAATGAVPLWFVHRTGHLTTCWAPPGSAGCVLRFKPDPTPDMN